MENSIGTWSGGNSVLLLGGMEWVINYNKTKKELGILWEKGSMDRTAEKGKEYVFGNNSECIGLCDIANQEIYIANDIPTQRAGMTLMHEILEAINGVYDLDLKHRRIVALEVALFQVLKDNFEIDLGMVFIAPHLSSMKRENMSVFPNSPEEA